MYDRLIQINVLSNDYLLEAAIKRVNPPERFQCTVHTYGQITPENAKCDILILETLDCSTIKRLDKVVEKTRLIICGEAEQLREIQQASAFNSCADFWLRPLTEEFINARLQKLLHEIKTETELWLTRNYLDTAIDSIPDLVWFKDIRGVHLKVNEAFCQAVGKTKEDVHGRGHYYIWDLEPEDYASGEYVCMETEEEVLRRKETCLFDEKVKSKRGLRQFKTYKSPIFDQGGEVLGTVGIAHDVTDLENVTTELEIILGSMPFAILINNNEGQIINVNETFNEYFEIMGQEVIGRDYDEWKHKEFPDLQDSQMEAVLYKGDQKRILEIHEKTIHDVFSAPMGQLCIYRDVTMERTMEEQILQNANTDFMTGLNNRRSFYEYISKCRGDQMVSLIYIDLDCFKQINDTYGHQAGDKALILVSQIMEECFPDAFISRLGGDEFLIAILGECRKAGLRQHAVLFQEKLRAAFSVSEELDGLSASVGIAQVDDPAVDIDTIIQQSDAALYQAKQLGPSRCCIYSEE